MRKIGTFHVVFVALFAALICVGTMLVQIPIPATGGYANLGDGVILIAAFLMGTGYATAAAGLGSMLADLLLGYVSYAPGTLIIKAGAALIAGLLAKMGDTCASYSYWTFGDVFEEAGIPDRIFHGGFGLVANGVVRKPTYWTFEFFKKLQGELILRPEDSLFVKTKEGHIRGVVWNLEKDALDIQIALPGLKGKWGAISRTVDMEHGNPLKLWDEMGQPASLTETQLKFLQENDRPVGKAWCLDGEKEEAKLSFHLMANAVTYVEITPFRKDESLGYTCPGICE